MRLRYNSGFCLYNCKGLILTRAYAGENAEVRIQNRRRKLVEAGKKCFGTKGFAKTKIKDICVEADLTERYFYESFRNKEALLGVVYVTLVDDMIGSLMAVAEEFQGRPVEAMRNLLIGYFTLFQDDPNRAQVQLFEILGVSDELNKVYQEKIREATLQMKSMVSNFLPSVPEDQLNPIYFTAFSGSLWQIANEWVLSGFEQDIEDLVAPLEKIINALFQVNF